MTECLFLAAGDLPVGNSWIPAWGGVELPMLIALPVLLIMSGFFSGSETALFGLSHAQRLAMRHGNSLTGRAVDALLEDQRMLLITILMCNMTINVLFFVITSVLMMRSATGALAQMIMAIIFLLLIVVLGEVGPKMMASSRRVRFATLCAPPLLTIHRIIGPLRVIVGAGVVTPLSRLTAPSTTPADLDDVELKTLLDVSGNEGIIDERERRMLREVLSMRKLRVHDVMTPRVRMCSIAADATKDDVREITRAQRLTKIPVCGENADDIIGVLHVKRYLLRDSIESVTDPAVMTAAQYVPDVATLEQLLEFFRLRRTQSAIVVDEYGGTEGVVSVEDLVEELVGDIVGPDEHPTEPTRLIGIGRWAIHGDTRVGDFAEQFSVDISGTRATTVSGLVSETLGRMATTDDVVEWPGWTLDVIEVDRARVVRAEMTMREPTSDADSAGDGSGSEANA